MKEELIKQLKAYQAECRKQEKEIDEDPDQLTTAVAMTMEGFLEFLEKSEEGGK